ncbi:PTS sugar transporter subunit IIB [Collinsella stercoris]|uniref:PTS system sorbose subfamily IIB component n=1 Tax=Collinsella stercoris DSM 13279 TaxID=445975 RepID=B6G9T9_9ACTN|nr:PTS sugar transporter subunit IIB [Collinsella stercoris]EEA90959.1 PTS system sorbose subfamily IIB component [Collinsella stercoris DSM 13279]UEA46348.1 PTS sugar transporter subunit IIB [Collinsella stercoris DSM 13279]UWP11134.1 PTS sugar transporter subunit IIB [Collinsella stercoris]
MIKLVRVDHRLLHGQVAVSWVNGIGADCILVASDTVVNDPVWKTTLKLGKPAGCKLVMKNIADSISAINSGVTDKYKLIVVVQTIADAKRLADGCPAITSINLGNTKESSTTKQVSRQIFLEPDEIEMLRELDARGVECEIRPMAADSKTNAITLL